MIVAITGGIGSGKSVVSQILRLLGYPVYDCDKNAKRLMQDSVQLRQELTEAFGENLYKDGKIDAAYLSSIVFSDASKLTILNSLVHPAVKTDILHWAEKEGGLVFVETAIPYSSGVNLIVDKIWRVEAPEKVRISRVMARNGVTEAQVKKRIAAQAQECVISDKDMLILNDGVNAVTPQIMENLQLLK